MDVLILIAILAILWTFISTVMYGLLYLMIGIWDREELNKSDREFAFFMAVIWPFGLLLLIAFGFGAILISIKALFKGIIFPEFPDLAEIYVNFLEKIRVWIERKRS